MPRIILIALIIGAVAYFIFRVFNDFFGGISATRSVVRNDFKQLDDLVDRYQLEPWRTEELDLISRRHDVTSENLMYSSIEHGQFFSIYEEPILAFATKEYQNNEKRLAVIKFNGKKYHFEVGQENALITEKGKEIGTINMEEGVRFNHMDRVLFIDSMSNSGLIPLTVNDEHTLSIATEDEYTGHTGRMLHSLATHDNRDAEMIILSIAFALADKQI